MFSLYGDIQNSSVIYMKILTLTHSRPVVYKQSVKQIDIQDLA